MMDKKRHANLCIMQNVSSSIKFFVVIATEFQVIFSHWLLVLWGVITGGNCWKVDYFLLCAAYPWNSHSISAGPGQDHRYCLTLDSVFLSLVGFKVDIANAAECYLR